MNPRTLLPNEQLSELITAVSSNRKSDIPEQRQDGQYMGAWAELDRQARITMTVANGQHYPVEPPDDCVLAVVIVLVIGIAAVFKLIQEA